VAGSVVGQHSNPITAKGPFESLEVISINSKKRQRKKKRVKKEKIHPKFTIKCP
jgi:hypothetical protein